MEVQKIKSKWKAQKRKEGIAQKQPAIAQTEEAEEYIRKPNSSGEDSVPAEPVSESGQEQDSSSEDEESADESGDERGSDTRPESARVQPRTRADVKQKGKMVERRQPSPGARQKGSNKRRKGQNDDQPPPSLRELNAIAYSRSSLHTFKAKPFHNSQEGPGRGRGRGRGTGRGVPSNRGWGQPNMRLRMNAMLEKIKQDFA